MDYGFVPGTDAQDDRMRAFWERRTPAVTLRTIPANVREFVRDLDIDANVTKPVDNLLMGAHASSEGYIFMPMFPGQVDPVTNQPTNQTDFETLEDTLNVAAHSITIPDTLIGFTPATGITRSVHFKGCNVGRNRFSARMPRSPFLTKLKKALGDHVNVTSPRHFHGLLTLDNGDGVFEYMAHEWVVRTAATRVGRGRYRGFANRAQLVTAYQGRNFLFADGTAVPNNVWTGLIPPAGTLPAQQTPATRRFNWPRDVSFSLGPNPVAGLRMLTVGREFRSYLESVTWEFTPTSPANPTTDAQKRAALRASMSTDPRLQSTHDWPWYERLDYVNFDAFFDGHFWEFAPTPTTPGDLVATGRRFDYTVLEPIVDRSSTPRTLIYNFWPTAGTGHAAVTSGFDETSNVYFGRA